MLRRLLMALCGLPLLLSVAILVLWVRSYGPRDAVERFVAQTYTEADWDIDDIIYSFRGNLLWVHLRHPELYGPVNSEKVDWRWFHPAPVDIDPEPDQNDIRLIPKHSSGLHIGWTTDLVLSPARLNGQ